MQSCTNQGRKIQTEKSFIKHYVQCDKVQLLCKTPWSSGKGEDSCPRDCEFQSRPCCRDHLSCIINLDQKHES